MRILGYSAKMEWKHHPIINVWINYIFTRSSSTRNLCHIWARKLTQFTLAQKIGFSNYILYLCIQIQGQYDAKWLWPIRCTKFCDCIIPLITNGVREMFGSPTHRRVRWNKTAKPYKRIVYKALLFLYIRKKELFKAVWPWPIRCPGHCPEWIRKARQKTKNMCNIPLLEEARKILDRYKEHPYCQAHSVLLPVCSNQKMNMYLKELADICR